MDRFIPLSIPNFEGNEKKYVDEAIAQEWVSTGGKCIAQLEEALAMFLGVPQVAACQSGTSALHMALVDCGVKPGDLVIVPTLTFIAAVNPVRYQFADPVFMDCDDSLCIDPIKLEYFCRDECTLENDRLIHKITRRCIKAIIVVHVFGNMADMVSIMDIAERYHLTVIEDATEALGTCYTTGRYEQKYAGTIGDYGAYSFNGNKIITTGGGGAITAKTADRVEHLRYLSTQAKDDPYYYIHDEIGYNYRMTNLQAALGVAQMEELPEFIKRKDKNYLIYQKAFKEYEYGDILEFREDTKPNHWFYALAIDRTKIKCPLRNIIEKLQSKGVQTRAVWGLIHEQKPYRDSIAYQIDKAKRYSDCIINIPCSTQLKKEDIQYTIWAIKEVLETMISI